MRMFFLSAALGAMLAGGIMLADAGTDGWRRFTDADYVRLRAQLERGACGFEPIGKELMRDCVLMTAADNSFDSAQLWLSKLRWDGVNRIDTFLVDYFGVEDSPYTRAVARYMWTALAGRVIEPGCKADMVPILVGDQGLGKSAAVKAMVPAEDFFAEISFAENEDNLSRKMRGKLIAEIGELKGLHSRDMETIKAFVTRSHEKWVPKYREFETVFPRRLIFIGTSNRDQFLADDTGNRRWLPVRVNKVDVKKIREVVDQLWAEASVKFVCEGVSWQGAQELSTAAHAEFSFHDEWTDRVQKWLISGCPGLDSGVAGLSTSEVLRLSIGLEGSKVRRADEMRVASVLKQLGYKSTRVFANGIQTRRWLTTSPLLPEVGKKVDLGKVLF